MIGDQPALGRHRRQGLGHPPDQGLPQQRQRGLILSQTPAVASGQNGPGELRVIMGPGILGLLPDHGAAAFFLVWAEKLYDSGEEPPGPARPRCARMKPPMAATSPGWKTGTAAAADAGPTRAMTWVRSGRRSSMAWIQHHDLGQGAGFVALHQDQINLRA